MRRGFHNLKLTGEAAGADVAAAEIILAKFLSVIQEHVYLPQQVFNLDETGLIWKRKPSKTFLSVQDKRAPAFKSSEDRFTLLLEGNASGDHKTKPPTAYHSENPRALNGYSKEDLPAVWRSHKKAWFTGALFEPYCCNELCGDLKAYCDRINLVLQFFCF
jgi:hypothetical protein